MKPTVPNPVSATFSNSNKADVGGLCVRPDWDYAPTVATSPLVGPNGVINAQIVHTLRSARFVLAASLFQQADGADRVTERRLIRFAFAQDMFNNISYPTSTALIVPPLQDLYTGINGGIAGTAVGTFQGLVPYASDTSPDFGKGYVVAIDPAIQGPPCDPAVAPWIAVYEIRVWRSATAITSIYGGTDGQAAVANEHFPTSLAVSVTDSQGSRQAAHGMPVRFRIASASATAVWDRAGTNQRYVSISEDGHDAVVLCQDGVAIAPRLIAGPAAGTLRVMAFADYSAQAVYFALTVKAAADPQDAYSVEVDQGDYQDQVWGQDFTRALTAKVYTKSGQAATTGKVQFLSTSDTATSVSFGGSNTKTVDVESNGATAPILHADPSYYDPSGYGTAVVLAFPANYPGDPESDTLGRVARYTERVWYKASATITKSQGDGDSAAQGQPFADRLVATVRDNANSPVPQVLVSFEINGEPWCASFDQQDTEAPVVEYSATKVLVRADSTGRATAPRVIAGTIGANSFTVAASATIASAATYQLHVEPAAYEGYSCAVNEGDGQDQVVGQDFETPLTVTVKDSDGNVASTGKVTFAALDANITGRFAGARTAEVDIDQGGAVSPTMTAFQVSAQNTSYVAFEVQAYTPDNTTPSADDGRTAVFRQRGWYSKAARLAATQGDGQSVLSGKQFALPLVVKVTDPNAPVEGMLVTFTLDGGAKFVQGSQRSAFVSFDESEVVVRSDPQGLATAPPIQAGDDAGPVTVTATATVAASALPFHLTVLSAATQVYNVYTAQGDQQDQLTGLDFSTRLGVLAKTEKGADASTGNVTFKIYPDTASATFLNVDGDQISVAIKNGLAFAPPLTALATQSSNNFTVVRVVAFPSDFSGDPLTDTSNQTAHFVEHVWSGNYVRVSATQGATQSAPMGQYFPTRVAALAVNGQVANTPPLQQYLVSFTITGDATFDLQDPDVAITSGNDKFVSVRTNDAGVATAPRILAGNSAGTATVTATGAASTSAAPFTLSIIDTATQAHSVYVETGDFQDQFLNEAYPTALSVSVKDASNRDAKTGKVTFKIFPGTIGAYFVQEEHIVNAITVDVVEGVAIADAPLYSDVALATPTYNSFKVVAFPADFSGDPEQDTSNQTAHFTERAWAPDVSVPLNKTAGEAQNTNTGQYFPTRLQVFAPYQDGGLPQYLVTFTITSGDATFDLNDNNPAVQLMPGGVPLAVTVRTNAQGYASAPRILAGDEPGKIQVSVAGAITALPPDDFNLTVVDASTAPYSVKVAGGDLQDEEIGYQFPIPLSVSVQDVNGRVCNTGTVTFRIAPDDDSEARFTGSTPDHATVPVKDGVATAPLLSTAMRAIAPWEHLVTKVIAYPDPFDLATDPPSRTAQFSERTWGPGTMMALQKTDGDNGTARMGEWFSDRLVTRATLDDEYLDGYLVKFTISTTTNTFDLNDPDPRVNIVSGNATSVLVRSDADGYATAPRILAGNTAAPFQVKAQGNIDNGTIFGLTVVAPAQLSYGIMPGAPSLTMTTQDKRRMSFYLFDQDTRIAIAGQTLNLSLTNNGTQVSFEQGNAGKTSVTCTTDSLGGVYQDVYANGGSGTATLTANSANVGQGCSVNVKVSS